MSQKHRLVKFACTLLLASLWLLPSAFAHNFKEKAHFLESASSLDAFVAAAANKKLVMLGESTHGTHEFYAWRDVISRRLISEHDFNFIVVEGDL
jgi:erythromycin esterase-like protein